MQLSHKLAKRSHMKELRNLKFHKTLNEWNQLFQLYFISYLPLTHILYLSFPSYTHLPPPGKHLSAPNLQ